MLFNLIFIDNTTSRRQSIKGTPYTCTPVTKTLDRKPERKTAAVVIEPLDKNPKILVNGAAKKKSNKFILDSFNTLKF